MDKTLNTILRIWSNGIFRILLFSGLLVFSFYVLPNETRNVLVPAIIGFFLSSLLSSVITTYRNSREDQVKSKQDEKFMNEVYPEEKPLALTVKGITRKIYYKTIGDDIDSIEFHHNDKKFELDELFKTYYFDILKSHSNSYIKNVDTLRLVDIKEVENPDGTRKHILYTQRTDYFDHLLTNRAIDFPIRGKASLRHIFESGPKIKELKQSKFANQIGFNCLVVLSDNTIILPRRSQNATYSKNKVTASLTGRLPMTLKTGSTEKDLEQFIKTEAKTTLGFTDELLNNASCKICSITRNLYEGGKPQIYFLLRFPDFSSDDYYHLRNKDLELHEDENKLDRNVRLHITDIDSIKFIGKKDRIKMNNKFEKKRKINVKPEKSFFVNLSYVLNEDQAVIS